jgi:serine/threonine protein kinase
MERTETYLNILLEYVGGTIYISITIGGSIAKLVQQFGPLKESIIKPYIRQIVEGLDYLHSNHIMHRDVKGANVLVDKNGICKLADFGSSK